MTDANRERRERLIDALRDEFDGVIQSQARWPYWRYVDDEMGSWNVLLPALYREWKGKEGGEVTDFYVGGMMDIATKAIPIIDEIDGTE